MKVKVSYTVDLEEVPKIVTDLLSECGKMMTTDSEKLTFCPHKFVDMTENIARVRQNLQLVDSKLEDVLNITSGWLQALEQEEYPAEELATQEQDDEQN